MRSLLAVSLLCSACGSDKSSNNLGSLDLASPPDLAGPDLAGPDFAGPDLAGPDLAGPDLAGPDLGGPDLASLAAPDLLQLDLVEPDLEPPCADQDGDGYFTQASCGPLDCDDTNPNAWVSCSTCVDNDHDGYFVGCDGYLSVRKDCDDTTATITANSEILGDGIDQDCDGSDGPPPGDSRIIYVSQTTGDDVNPGTMTMPVATVDRAVELANASIVGNEAQRHFIFIAAGDYSISESLSGGTSLYGGFDPAGWGSSGSPTVITATGGNSGLAVTNYYDQTTLQNLTVHGLDGSDTSIGLQLLSDTVVVDCIIAAAQATTFSEAIAQINVPLTLLRTEVDAGPSQYTDGISAGSADLTIRDSTISTLGNPALSGRSYAVKYYGSDASRLSISGSSLSASASSDVQALDLSSVYHPMVELYDNTIDVSAGGAAGATVIAVYGYGQQHIAIRNRITVTGGADSRGYMVLAKSRSQLISNTVLLASGSNQTNVGIWVFNATADLINNSVHVPNGAWAVRVQGNGTRLYNNLIVAGTTSGSVALDLAISSTPNTTLDNNSLFAAPSGCGLHVSTCQDSVVNACSWSGCLEARNNLASDCGIGAGDFHISPGSACQSAGLDPTLVSPSPSPLPSWVSPSPFPDIDGEPRPQGSWDVGADEIPN